MFKKSTKSIYSLIVALIISISLIGCGTKENIVDKTDTVKPNNESTVDNATSNSKVNSKVHFIDTGNSDSILIENNGEFALVDAGDNDDDEKVLSYLKSAGVTKLKYLIMTHPHADHIGAMDNVVKEYSIEKIIAGQGTSATRTYEKIIEEMKKKDYKFYAPKEGEEMTLGSGILKFYNAQNKDFGSNTNNASVVVKYTNGEDDFLLMGDAETEIEDNLKDKLGDVEVLKAGHHGSHSSSSPNFVKEVKPEFIVIMVGAGNKYGHPHKESIDLFNKLNIPVYRNDENGNIIFESSGNGVPQTVGIESHTGAITNTTVNNANDEIEDELADSTITPVAENVFFTESGKSYHLKKDCPTLSRSKNILTDTIESAIKKGKTDPCDKCAK